MIEQVVDVEPKRQEDSNPENWLSTCNELLDDGLVKEVLYGFDKIRTRLATELEDRHGLNFKAVVARFDGVQNFMAVPHPYHSAKHAQVVNEESARLLGDMAKYCPWLMLSVSSSEHVTLWDTSSEYRNKTINAIKIFAIYVSVLATGHDIVQEGEVLENGTLRRKRGVEPGQNEYETAARLVNELLAQFNGNPRALALLQTMGIVDEGGQRVRRDIFSTYTRFDPEAVLPSEDKASLRLEQIYYSEATIAGRVIALSDLYSQYFGDVESAKLWSNAEFWEVNQDMLQLAKKLDPVDKLPGQLDYFHIKAGLEELFSRIDIWWKGQSGFVKWLNENMRATQSLPENVITQDEKTMIARFYDPDKNVLPYALENWHREVGNYIDKIKSNGNLGLSHNVELLLIAMNYYDLNLHKVNSAND